MLTVLNVGYPLAPVGPDAVGGAEQVLWQIDRALVKAGHRSIVMAPRGSTCAGELVPLEPAVEPFDDRVIQRARAGCRAMLDALLAREPIDIVHFHGVDCTEYMPSTSGVAVVVTLHLWPDRYPNLQARASQPDLHLVCVSQAQWAACERVDMRPCRTILNGVDVPTFRVNGTRDRSVLLLGRISPEKGFHLAIDAARRAELSVVLAGRVFPYRSHCEYFDYVLAPRLGGDVRYVGPVDAVVKRQLLAKASCVGIPSIVPETSSLTAMEALASGTPVVALKSPALDELIDDGTTGFLVRDVDEMAAAFARVPSLSRVDCRRTAEHRCGLDRMTSEYLAFYKQLVGRHEPVEPLAR